MGDVTKFPTDESKQQEEIIEILEAMIESTKAGDIESVVAIVNGPEGTFHYCLIGSYDFADINLHWDAMKIELITEGLV